LLIDAVEMLDVSTAGVAFVGDSISDAEAARLVGAVFVGYANKPGKRSRFMSIHVDAVVQTMYQLEQVVPVV